MTKAIILLIISALALSPILAQESNSNIIPAVRQTKLADALIKFDTRWGSGDREHMRFSSIGYEIIKISVQWGLVIDPVPDPIIYYANQKNEIFNTIEQALTSTKKQAASREEALLLAKLVVSEEEPFALLLVDSKTMKPLPAKWVSKYTVGVPQVAKTDSGYAVEIFTYQEPKQGRFSQLQRAEELKLNRVTMGNGVIGYFSEQKNPSSLGP